MKEFTGFYDVQAQPINDGDILLNPIAKDLWIVEQENGTYFIYLVPSSG